MRILLSSYYFNPSIGGIETSSMLYAEGLTKLNNEVIVITNTEEVSEDEYSWKFKVIRNPSLKKQIELYEWCDVVLHNNICLKKAWPILFVNRPWFIIHQTWLSDGSFRSSLLSIIKRAACHFANNIVISSSLEIGFETICDPIGNPYDESVFKCFNNNQERHGIGFVGRLVSDKGVDILINAVSNIKNKFQNLKVKIIGEGEQKKYLVKLIEDLGLKNEITFLGKKTGSDLALQLNCIDTVVVPSRWDEPFGIVAIEAIACGCVVIGSKNGGLSEAIGNCGLVFDNNRVDQLSECIEKIYFNSKLKAKLKKNMPRHIEKYRQFHLSNKINNLLKKEIISR